MWVCVECEGKHKECEMVFNVGLGKRFGSNMLIVIKFLRYVRCLMDAGI